MKRENKMPGLKLVSDFLEQHKNQIAEKVSQRIFNELPTYSKGPMAIEESIQTNLNFLDFIILNLSLGGTVWINEEEFIKKVVDFEQGIASRRARYRIKLTDTLHGLRILRNEIWRELEANLKDQLTVEQWFEVEKRINKLFVSHLISICSQYLKLQEQLIEDQQWALKKWEEVVRSASRIDLKLPCRSEFAVIARMQAEAIARRVGYTEEEIQDIKTAVGEACDNAIEHGASPQGIRVYYQLTMENLIVEVQDFGHGFNPNGYGDNLPDPLAERGRGIFLMNRFMDSVEYIRDPETPGTKVILSKHRIFK